MSDRVKVGAAFVLILFFGSAEVGNAERLCKIEKHLSIKSDNSLICEWVSP